MLFILCHFRPKISFMLFARWWRKFEEKQSMTFLCLKWQAFYQKFSKLIHSVGTFQDSSCLLQNPSLPHVSVHLSPHSHSTHSEEDQSISRSPTSPQATPSSTTQSDQSAPSSIRHHPYMTGQIIVVLLLHHYHRTIEESQCYDIIDFKLQFHLWTICNSLHFLILFSLKSRII